jgi:hypothetical protein
LLFAPCSLIMRVVSDGSGAGWNVSANSLSRKGETQKGLQPYCLGALVQFPVTVALLVTNPPFVVKPAALGYRCV